MHMIRRSLLVISVILCGAVVGGIAVRLVSSPDLPAFAIQAVPWSIAVAALVTPTLSLTTGAKRLEAVMVVLAVSSYAALWLEAAFLALQGGLIMPVAYILTHAQFYVWVLSGAAGLAVGLRHERARGPASPIPARKAIALVVAIPPVACIIGQAAAVLLFTVYVSTVGRLLSR